MHYEMEDLDKAVALKSLGYSTELSDEELAAKIYNKRKQSEKGIK